MKKQFKEKIIGNYKHIPTKNGMIFKKVKGFNTNTNTEGDVLPLAKKEFNLSKKKQRIGYTWHYKEKDIKEAIRLLKEIWVLEFIKGSQTQTVEFESEKYHERIDKIFGEKLKGGKEND